MPKHTLDIKTQTLLDDYGKFFREFPDVQAIDEEPFWLWFKSFGHPNLKPDTLDYYREIVRQIQQPVPEDLEAGLMGRLVAADTAHRLTNMLERWNEGEELDLGSTLRATVEQFELDTNRKVKTPWVRDRISDLLQDDQHDTGLHWRLPDLNLSMRPLRPGDFGIIAARPDVGKTSFTADQLTHFAAQLPELYPDEERSILWFNNEGPGRRIVQRLYNAALDMTTSELVELNKMGVIEQKYEEALNGPSSRIRVFDIHDFWNHEVEDIIRQTPPALILFDMIDNIKFGGGVNNNGQRTDQLLEAMYQWARVIGVKHDCVVLGTSQISADGENLCYPTLSMLKDSKTGKQGAADFILTIGAQQDFPSSRYLGLTKNKLAREGAPKAPKIETIMDGLRSRYRSPLETNGAE
ncbi:AAA family ATPase [Tsuneonella sp. HG222]